MGALLAVGVALAVGVVGRESSTAAVGASSRACRRVATPRGYVRSENRKRGTRGWKFRPARRKSHLGAFANRVSAHCGQVVRVYVSTRAHHARLTAYRMGYYHGLGARKIYSTKAFRTHLQPPPHFSARTNTASAANWKVSTSFKVDGRFVPGSYLLKVVDGRGSETYVPLTVTDPTSRARLALMSEPMTWQAYNTWGGASAYHGADGSHDSRARVVSFDRPYAYGHGAATYFTDEYPLVRALEKAGLDVTYLTDVDVSRDPDRLLHHHGVLLGAHSEYWTKAMRDGFSRARHAGENLAFLGANFSYWQVRMRRSPVGRDRHMVIYKSAAEDPLSKIKPKLTTVHWRQPPVNRPESALIGQEYQCWGVKAPLDISSPAWPFKVNPGTKLRDTVLDEYDRANLGPTPHRLQILATSHLRCRDKPRIANVTYYTARSGAGVFSAGTMGWVCQMNGSCTRLDARSTPRARRVLTSTTVRLARAMAAGPLGRHHPSHASKLPPRRVRRRAKVR